MWWIGIIIAVAVFFALWALFRWNKSWYSSLLSVANVAAQGASAIAAALGHGADTRVGKIILYAQEAVASLEQSYKRVKEHWDGTQEGLAALNDKIKDEAILMMEKMAEIDDQPLDKNEREIARGLIEAAVFFLPKSRQSDDSNTEETT